ncbi:Methyltransferase domain protein [Thiorhodovibrio winogradskyi]|uniref:Methyltransferase domain protein n=1 Tax=Thiorhodovibrio winogradskyi TaxID=77007 RepID=A0ABZ0S5K0_9GAMM|nr:methyltransferase domain-containing protein [Thiorhodovibrio winogradskyi]
MTDLPDIDQIIARVRAEAQEAEYGPSQSDPLVPMVPLAPSQGTRGAGGEAPVTITHVNDLLAVGDDANFLEQAYLALLRRPADPVGLEYNMGLLKAYGRPMVLCALRWSPEGRDLKVRLPGFGLAWPLYRVWGLFQRRGHGHLLRLPHLLYHRWRRLLLFFDRRQLFRLDSMQRQLSKHLDTISAELAAVQGNTEQQANNLSANISQLASQSEQKAQDLNASIARLASQSEQLASQSDQLASQSKEHGNELTVLHARVKMLQLQVQPIDTPSGNADQPAPKPRSPADLEARIDAFYLAFEEHMRGSQAEVSELLSGYLPDLEGLPESLQGMPLLDIGSGRGEWLQLLAQQGFTAEGIEINPLIAGQAHAAGLQVHCADALDHLRGLPDNSRAAISAFHVAEHLPFSLLFALLEQSWRVLAPGGLLILETPNPENLLVGSHTFWHDFSHQRPLTPAAFEFLVRFHGFAAVRLRRLHPYPDAAKVAGGDAPQLAARINGHFYGPQDYAVLANKPPAEAPASDPSEDETA